MALLEANTGGGWYSLPTPSSYKPTYTHLENSYNDNNGNLHRDFIWKNRAKVLCGWNYLEASQVSLLESLYDKEEFYLRYTDNYNNRVEKIMYAGPLDNSVGKLSPNELMLLYSTEITMNFIEKRR